MPENMPEIPQVLCRPPWEILEHPAGRGMIFNFYNNNNKRPLTPKSMPPAGDEHAKLKT